MFSFQLTNLSVSKCVAFEGFSWRVASPRHQQYRCWRFHPRYSIFFLFHGFSGVHTSAHIHDTIVGVQHDKHVVANTETALTAATLCMGGPPRGRRGTQSRSASLWTVRHTPTCGELGLLEFFGHRLKTLVTCATVEDCLAVLCQTLRT